MDLRFFTIFLEHTGPSKPTNDTFIDGYRSGLADEYQRCQDEHRQIIDGIWKFYAKKLGPRKFLELQKQYAAENQARQI